MISALHHIAIKVCSLKKSREFYEKVFGWSVFDVKTDEHQSPRAYWYKLGEVIFMIETGGKLLTLGAESKGVIAFTISKSEREKFLRHLKNLNISITHESEFSIYFNDPDGNRLALSHYS